MANQYVNKVVVNGVTKIDLTGDTVVANKLLSGYTAHDASGALITGTSTFNADTSDTTAVAAEVLSGETFYGPTGSKVTGTMPNRGAVTGTITTVAGTFTIQQGYHDGSGVVSISSTEQAKLIAANIRQGVTILGVEGTMAPDEGVVAQSKNVTPSFSVQNILPDEGYTHLSEVVVAAIPVTESDNAQGGVTLTVG